MARSQRIVSGGRAAIDSRDACKKSARMKPGHMSRRHEEARDRGMDLREHIRGIPDFPKPGILFYDISTLLRHADAWQVAMDRLAETVRPYRPDLLAGIESRGFLMAAPLALKLGCGFLMLRKRGKLPGRTIGHEYALEYGTDRVEIQADAVEGGERVVLVDDLLATGGTMAAGIALLRQVGAVVPGAAALIELTFLDGRARLDVPFASLIQYDS
jgi:adenine phosphoribosyltransferase